MNIDRPQTKTTESYVSSFQANVIKISRPPSKRKKTSSNVIHINIRPSNHIGSIDNKTINHYNTTRSVRCLSATKHHREHSEKQKPTISRDLTASLKSMQTGSSKKIVRLHRSLSKSSGNTKTSHISVKRVIRTRENRHHYYGKMTGNKMWLSSSSKVAHHQTNDSLSDRHGPTKNYHRDLKRKIKKCPTRRCVIGFVIATFFLILIIAIILLVLLLKPTKKKQAPILTPLLRWNTSGITVAGNPGDPLNYPFDVAVDHTDTLYVTDHYNNRVQKYLMGAANGTTVAGDTNGALGLSPNRLETPSRVIVDSDGDIYISDTGNQRVQFWTKGASAGTTVAGIGGLGNLTNQLNSPFGIARDWNKGTLYVVDYNNQRVMSYTPGASSGIVVAGGHGAGLNHNQLNDPFALYFDSLSNSLIISNLLGNNIVRWVLGDNNWILLAGDNNGTAGNTSTLFNSPADVTFDPMGNMYVADANNYRIQFFMVGQSVGITIAGISGISGNKSTMLNAPQSVELDNQLNLYVTDTFNQRIQKFLRY